MTISAPPSPGPVAASISTTFDSWSPDLQLLLGEDAEGPLRTLIETADGELLSFRPGQVTHRPSPSTDGSSTIVQYGARVRWPDGQEAKETLVMATGGQTPPNAAVLDGDGVRVAIWRWPFDPYLPGLAAAVDADSVGRLLADLGLGGGTVRLSVRAYRPGRRAVIEVSGSHGRVFLKVVRPSRVEALHRKHRLLAEHLPVPHSWGFSANGILVLQALHGRSLRAALTGAATPLPGVVALEGLLNRLPADATGGQPTGEHLLRATHYADVVAASLPDERARLDALIDRYGDIETGQQPLVGVHGDFYEGQLLVDRGQVTGLLDVDTTGNGHRIDEWATMLAHVSVLGLLHPKARRIKRYGADLLAAVETRFPATELRPRISAAVLGLATGPFRVLLQRWPEQTRRRIGLAEEWLTSPAGRSSSQMTISVAGHKDSLTAVS